LGLPSCHQRLALHRPAERLGHRGIEVGDEALDPLLQMLLRGEIAAAEKLADQDRKPDFDLVDPRGVLGREMLRTGLCCGGSHLSPETGLSAAVSAT
jgi:hypothetical protein